MKLTSNLNVHIKQNYKTMIKKMCRTITIFKS